MDVSSTSQNHQERTKSSEESSEYENKESSSSSNLKTKKRSLKQKSFRIVDSERLNSFNFSELLEYTKKLSSTFRKRDKKIRKLKEKVKSLKIYISKLRRRNISSKTEDKIEEEKDITLDVQIDQCEYESTWIKKEPQYETETTDMDLLNFNPNNENEDFTYLSNNLKFPYVKSEPFEDYDAIAANESKSIFTEIPLQIKRFDSYESEMDFSSNNNGKVKRKNISSLKDRIKCEPPDPSIIAEFPSLITIITTQKNKDMISYKGYNYRQEKTAEKKIYWSCKNKSYNCKSRLQTSRKINETYALITEPTSHNHSPVIMIPEKEDDIDFNVSQYISDNSTMFVKNECSTNNSF